MILIQICPILCCTYTVQKPQGSINEQYINKCIDIHYFYSWTTVRRSKDQQNGSIWRNLHRSSILIPGPLYKIFASLESYEKSYYIIGLSPVGLSRLKKMSCSAKNHCDGILYKRATGSYSRSHRGDYIYTNVVCVVTTTVARTRGMGRAYQNGAILDRTHSWCSGSRTRGLVAGIADLSARS